VELTDEELIKKIRERRARLGLLDE
jgi:hypothetical protein